MSTRGSRKQESFLQHLISSSRIRAAEAATLGRDAATMYPEELAKLAVEKGLLSEDDAYHSLADFYNCPYIDMTATTVDLSALDKLPAATARELMVLPFLLNDNELSVAAPAFDLDLLDRLRSESGCEPYIHVASRLQIDGALELYYPAMTLSEAEQAAKMGSYLSATGDSPVVKDIAAALVTNGVRSRASDIHVEPQETFIRVRMRVDGVLHEEIRLPLELGPPLVARFKIMADLDIAETRHPQDGRIEYEMKARRVDLRISFAPSICGEKIVIRLLDQSAAVSDLRAMELSVAVDERLERMISVPSGVVLVTGPTGSGKSTTCHAILDELRSEKTNIVTIEDPVEYRMEGLTQIQVQSGIGLTFASVLRSVLRQDPDVILVGEIRDLETASIAAQAALTGHLVVSTLHTNNAVQAVIRLVDMGVDPYMVAPALNGVLGQRLARRICARCKQQVEPSVEELAMFEPYGVVPDALYRGEGCVDCAQSGYRGRIGVHEIVVVDDTIRQLIIDRAPLHQVEMAACREGYRSLRYDALKKALAGLTTTSEVRRVTVAREDFVVAG